MKCVSKVILLSREAVLCRLVKRRIEYCKGSRKQGRRIPGGITERVKLPLFLYYEMKIETKSA